MLARAIRYAIERKHVEQTQRFLAEASSILTASLDYTTTLDRLAHLAVPELADWCAIHMIEADGTILRLAVAHVDPAKATLARERAGRYPLDPNAQHIVPQVLRSGQPELYSEVPDSLLMASARDTQHLELLRLLGFKSYICVPLIIHRRILGAITLAGRRVRAAATTSTIWRWPRSWPAAPPPRSITHSSTVWPRRKSPSGSEARSTMRESQERLAGIVGSAMDAIISIDGSQRILVFNTAAEHVFRCPAAEALGQPIDRFVPTIFRPAHAEYIRAFGHTGVTSRSMGSLKALTAIRADGEEFPIEATISQTVAAGQKLYTVIIRDITARKRVEEQLLYQATLLHNVSDAIVASDLRFQITNWNQAAEALYGWSAAEVIGQPVQDILKTTYADDQSDRVRQQFQEHGLWRGEAIQNRKDGTWITVLASVTLVQDANGQQVGVVAVNRDITEQKRLEQQFIQAQKMESVGRLAGGIAHDFNNLLTAISGYAELVLQALPAHSIAHEDQQEIIKASSRAAGLTRQLLAFARKQIIEPQVLQLNNLIGDIDRMLRRLIGEDIEMVTLLSPDLGKVKVDPGQIEQVLVNLAVNARDAMPQGGRLTVETHYVELDHDYAQQHFGIAPGPYALIVVSDTGSGMDAETQARVFEPFFTTKGPEHGTGLGLATCYGIVKQHGGSIWVYSEPQRGTTFKIYLPQIDAPIAALAQFGSPGDLPRGVETVLLAEDDPAVRALAVRVLGEQGYRVLEAVDGATALRLASEYIGTTIDLLLTDVVMPQISGRALFEQINALHPNIKALFMSGYTDDAIVRQGQLDAGVAFLQKPFSSAALVRKVRAVLDKVTSETT